MYLVTGGGGFIGSHLVRTLVQRGERVRVLDLAEKASRVATQAELEAVEWLRGDIRDMETVRRACAGVEVVLHHAAIASVPRSIAEPDASHAVNITGTLHVLMAAREAGVRRVIFASSSAVYGADPTPVKSEDLPTRPISPYGAQKLAAEAYCPVWHGIYGLETVALRYFNVFGPGQDPQSEYAAVIPRFLIAALRGETPTVYGDGEQSRDFIYVGNVVDVNLLAATAPGAAGSILNVGMGRGVTLNQLLVQIGRELGREIAADYQPARPGDIRESVSDVTRLRTVLGYEPAISFEEGLARSIRAYAAEISGNPA